MLLIGNIDTFYGADQLTKNKINLVAWDQGTKPKTLGRLGLCKASHINKVGLAKLNWWLFRDKHSR